jgi:choline-sulfatase
MQATNFICILSDEHNKRALGCYGHELVRTPNLDALASRGTRFEAAYTNCPICVPARASLATGQYVHRTGCWDNAIAYRGDPPSWGHRLMEAGHRCVSIGKLHYQSSDPGRNGFDEEILPLHIVNGVGDLLGLIRDELPVRAGSRKLGPEAGPGESEYTRYDRDIAAATCRWLEREAPRHRDKPWVLYVGFVSPHFPLIAPPEFYDLYVDQALPRPAMYAREERPTHPFIDAMRRCLCFDEAFDEAMLQRALAAYFGLVSFLDDNIGKILRTVWAAGLESSTRILYSSDHGDNLGARGLWGKSTMYEESAGVPMILAGPGIPRANATGAPVSLVDVYPTLLQSVGLNARGSVAGYPGHSLIEVADGYMPDRTILSEYHAAGAATGAYMIRHGRYKYVHYVGMAPMLFDLLADPGERIDLAPDAAHAGVIAECEAALRRVVDPEAVDARARADQHAMIAHHGGTAAILARGTFRYSPPPGAEPTYFEAQK